MVVIHDTELLAETDNATSSSGGKLFAKTVNEFVRGGLVSCSGS